MVVRDIGLNVKPPKTNCNDPVCPFHGSLGVSGRVFEGTVAASKSPKTVSAERAYLHFNRKYNRYERPRRRTLAHNPPCIQSSTDGKVIFAECRLISKEVTYD